MYNQDPWAVTCKAMLPAFQEVIYGPLYTMQLMQIQLPICARRPQININVH